MVLPAPGAVFGRYVLRSKLATGGMAEIWLAEQVAAEGVSKLVVLKLMLPHLLEGANYVRMFLDEARLASRLSHPNVVQVFDFGEVAGRHWLAMEYLPGENLGAIFHEAWDKDRPIPVEVVLRIGAAACDGLHYAHELADAGSPLSIVHRDVSPSNVMVTYQGDVKVLDFGIARGALRTQERTATGEVKGKVAYASPEQLRGTALDRRSDVFSLGIVLHELATGQRLFRREDDLETMFAIARASVPPASSLRSDAPPELDAVLARALARDPAERYATALEMRRALEGLMRGPSIRLDEYLIGLFGEQRAGERVEVPSSLSRHRTAFNAAAAATGPEDEATRLAATASREGASPARQSRRRKRVALALVAVALAVAAVAGGLALRRDDRLAQAATLAHRGEHERARDQLRAYLVDNPTDGTAATLALLVQWWTTAPHIEDALERARGAKLDDAQRSVVAAIHLMNEGRNAEAIAYLEPQVAKQGERRADLLYVLGEAEWHSGALRKGAATLRSAVDADPRWLMALHHAVDFHLAQAEPEVVEAIAARVAPTDPEKSAELETLALMHRRRYDDAVRVAMRTLEKHPGAARLWSRLAEASALRGDWEKMGVAAGKAFETWPVDDRETGGIAARAEWLVYRGELAELAQLVGAKSGTRSLVDVLWHERRALMGRPTVRGLLAPPIWAATHLASIHVDGGDDRDFWDGYLELDVRAYGQGLAAEQAKDLAGAAAIYEKALAREQGGEIRMLLAHHLARVRVSLGDAKGAAAVCDEVIHPRLYKPVRALLWHDCLAWSARAAASPDESRKLYRELLAPWRGELDHPAVREAREKTR